jgi:Leucine-rich repeat (LRR) protein
MLLPLQLAPLLGLMRLQQLDVSHNSVSSLAPLSALGRLTQLDCRDNRVASLTDVTSLTRLVELYAANNTVADIEVTALEAPGRQQLRLHRASQQQHRCPTCRRLSSW